MLLAGIYSMRMDSRLKTSGMMTITVIIYWDWYNKVCGAYPHKLYRLKMLARESIVGSLIAIIEMLVIDFD